MARKISFLILIFLFGTLLACSKNGSTLLPDDSTTTPVDPNVPVVTLASPTSGSRLNITSLTLTGACTESAGNVTISGTGIQSTVIVPCTSGAYSAPVSLTLTDGTKDFTVSQTNSYGTTTNAFTIVRSCPENYVVIPADTSLGTTEFCLAKYEMKLKTNAGAAVFDGYNGNVAVDETQYLPDSRPDGIPWIQISQANAILECASLGAGYHLVTAKEWSAMARNVESYAPNWSSGSAGSGTLVKGHTDNAVSASAVADGFAVVGSNLLSAGAGTDSYTGTGNTSVEAWGAGKEQRRTFTLTTFENIWDISGNAREFNDIDGLGSTISYTGPGASTYHDVFSATVISFISTISISGGGTFDSTWIQPANLGLDNATNSTGQIYIQSGARVGKIMTRGGDFTPAVNPGIFAADFDSDNTSQGSTVGFRCAKTP